MVKSLVILGANGYTGRAVVKQAVAQQQWHVTAMVRTIPSVPIRGVNYVVGMLPDRLFVAGLREADVVMHLAVEKSDHDVELLQRVNVDGTRAVLDAMGGNTALIYASSMSVYGQGVQGGVTEHHALQPGTELARSRCEAEHIVISTAKKRRTTAFIVRPRFLMGSDDRSFLPLIRRYYRSPLRPIRPVKMSVIDIDDYATILLRLAERAVERTRSGEQVQRAFNIAYRAPITLTKLCELVVPGAGRRRFAIPAESVRAIASLVPGRTATRLCTQLELVTYSHWGNVDAAATETGLALFDKDPETVVASYRHHTEEQQ